MYKTVRHGENSLQYTILPQTEEVLNNSGLKGKGRDYSPSIHVRRSRRRSTSTYAAVIMCGIVTVLILASLPMYIMNAVIYARMTLMAYDRPDIITTAPLSATGRETASSLKKELKILPEFLSTQHTKTETETLPNVHTTSVLTTVTRDKATTPPWTMPALRSWKGLTPATTSQPVPTEAMDEIPLIGTPSGSVRLLDSFMSVKPWEKDIIIRPTFTPEPMTVRNVFKYYSRAFATSDKSVTGNAKMFDDVLITTRATTTRPPTTTASSTPMVLIDEGDELKESLEVDEVFSLPPLKAELGVPISDSDEVTVAKAGGNSWARWPFVDPSSYVQWTGYSVGDNLLLVAAMSSMVMVLLLALVLKRRRRTSSTSAQIGKITADLQEDDNTNLLQAENPEEGEE